MARKRMAGNDLSEEQALLEVLMQSAGDRPLAALLETRRQENRRQHERIAMRRQAQAARLAARRATTAPADAWLAWFDGSARPNPGRMGMGAILQAPDGRTIQLGVTGGHGDSSQAEYLALHAVLDAAVQHGVSRLVVHGDSRVVIDDVLAANGRTAAALSASRQHALQLMARIGSVTLTWIPRHRNVAADRLSQHASRHSGTQSAPRLP
ncbi:hypothetical protein GCM10007205_17650 [Oxalicibacterium flavum]|uniref:RNase H type-1 domain-containing protein n=1 Tax=Oxalicibacterium flavum TaxID=179467 RepID=A0A8J2UN00_9BURK|nr:ribonuclease HI family protein [Oxalicibacterium flavum]GGC08987.1 hypothetical protein GCM10007205_17650 [Oxalicibacterium flavum]